MNSPTIASTSGSAGESPNGARTGASAAARTGTVSMNRPTIASTPGSAGVSPNGARAGASACASAAARTGTVSMNRPTIVSTPGSAGVSPNGARTGASAAARIGTVSMNRPTIASTPSSAGESPNIVTAKTALLVRVCAGVARALGGAVPGQGAGGAVPGQAAEGAVRVRGAGVAVLVLAVVAVLAARFVARWALGDVPHVMDEIAYDLQAKTMAEGSLALAVRLPRAAFAMWFVDDRREMFGIFPPGWPAVLALFHRVGLDAWANPLLHGGATLAVAAAARRLAGPRARVLAAALYGLSPQALLLAASRMSHTLVALGAAGVLLAGTAWVRGAGRRRVASGGAAAGGYGGFAVGGVGLGAVVLTRPLCAMVLGVTAAGFGVVAWRGAAARRAAVRRAAGEAARGAAAAGEAMRVGAQRKVSVWAACAAFLAPVGIAVVLLGAYNHRLTGSATRFPQSAYFDEHVPPRDDPFFAFHAGCNDLGFGHGCDHGIRNASHDPENALSNTADNLVAWTFLAGGGPLVFAAAAYAVARSRRRALLLAALVPVPGVILAYALYWYGGTCFGARFYHAALPSLLAVGAAGLVARSRPSQLSRSAHSMRSSRTTAAIAAVWFAWNAVVMVVAVREIRGSYWGTDDRFAHLVASWTERKEPDALVMVAFRHAENPARATYRLTSFLRDAEFKNGIRALGALAQNRADLGGPIVFAKYHPALVPELRARFPKRALWLYIVEDDPRGPRADTLQRVDAAAVSDAPERERPPKENFDAFHIP
ncbi:hypothetical protein [Pendulispora albinea]|uniref:Glycosyltransferase RgtA/B/C/D-like domain-containing protein n=1 Tax=Pendulispora albinea TaxID=2741071 RepID=A0ABZ2LSD0_9BACT